MPDKSKSLAKKLKESSAEERAQLRKALELAESDDDIEDDDDGDVTAAMLKLQDANSGLAKRVEELEKLAKNAGGTGGGGGKKKQSFLDRLLG